MLRNASFALFYCELPWTEGYAMNTELIVRNVTLAQLGDRAAFSELVRECQPLVYATALEKLRDGEIGRASCRERV